MTISRDDVIRVAALARLELDEDSIEGLATDLAKVVGYIQKLDELDTDGVEPTAQVEVVAAPLRPDVARAGLSRELVMREAPRATDEGFRVPGFVDET